ncbi:unnamed protein product [Absidia cylindrospora]
MTTATANRTKDPVHGFTPPPTRRHDDLSKGIHFQQASETNLYHFLATVFDDSEYGEIAQVKQPKPPRNIDSINKKKRAMDGSKVDIIYRSRGVCVEAGREQGMDKSTKEIDDGPPEATQGHEEYAV